VIGVVGKWMLKMIAESGDQLPWTWESINNRRKRIHGR
jgi:hypothetical protein